MTTLATMKLPMQVSVCIAQGLFELLGLGGFLCGYFLDITWLMLAGGILVVVDDVVEIGMGVLNPLFPILLALVLAVIFTPWYTGVFWAAAAFKVLNIPVSFKKVMAPKRFLASRVEQETGPG